ncbi:unnamed protein product, partial [Mesorhabditis spiculigera]
MCYGFVNDLVAAWMEEIEFTEPTEAQASSSSQRSYQENSGDPEFQRILAELREFEEGEQSNSGSWKEEYIDNKKYCRACRWEKCVAVGLQQEAVRQGALAGRRGRAHGWRAKKPYANGSSSSLQ